jgi:hypothetical protein
MKELTRPDKKGRPEPNPIPFCLRRWEWLHAPRVLLMV